MNRLPRPKIYATNADKSRAYQQRKREERNALEALGALMVAKGGETPMTFNEALEALTEEQRKAVLRVYVGAKTAETLQKVAG
jgi:DNA-directed RNA polymerase specialized sigma24 family protein